MSLLRHRPLRLAIVATWLALVTIPWLIDPRGFAVDWFDFALAGEVAEEVPEEVAEENASPSPGEMAALALFRMLGSVGAALAVSIAVGAAVRTWRPAADLAGTLAMIGLAAAVITTVIVDGLPGGTTLLIGGIATGLAIWSLVTPLLGRGPDATEESDGLSEDEDEDEEEEEEEEA